MSQEQRRPDQLASVEQWKSSELEDARLKMVQLDAIAADKQADVKRIEADIATLQTFARRQANELSPLDADALLRLNEFNAFQQHQLRSARLSYEQAARQADDAQQDVSRLFENLSVLQRLIERRRELANQEEQRQAQKQLDEGALTRAPHRNESNDSEDQGHGS